MQANAETADLRVAKKRGTAAITLSQVVLLAVLAGVNGRAETNTNDWSLLWQPNGTTLPKPTKVHIGSLADLGPELENREWLMVPTRSHQLLFQDSTDRKKVAELYQLIDGLYVFLSGRSPARPTPPILAFLMPDEGGHSRCSRKIPAMRTGDQGEVPFLLTSFLHEETHLFNFAFLEGKAQGWWTGEFCCIYFQERARLEHEGKALKEELQTRLPRGPVAGLTELDAQGKAAFDEALAAFVFLEDRYGRASLNQFRRQCLIASRATNGRTLPPAVFRQAFSKDGGVLDAEWRAFYGWASASPGQKATTADPRLETKVTYATKQASVQDVVRQLAAQVGLDYNFQKSFSQTDPLCRRYVNDVAIENRPCREALQAILGPLGLRYEIEDQAIVLYRK